MSANNQKPLNIIIMGPLTFPRPDASTSRVTAYAKGMIENGAQVKVLCVRPAGQSEIAPEGDFQGIPYRYSAGVTTYQKSRFKQIYLEIKALFAAIVLLARFHRQRRIDAILFYAAHIYHEITFSCLAKLMGITVLKDVCEYPFYFDRSTNLKLKIKGYLYERLVFPFFDALIIMTHALEDYCKPFLRKSARYLMVPIMVDPARFENVEPVNITGRYIAYCGDPYGTKDGVDILLDAFSKITDKHPDVKLYIIGNTVDRRDPDFLKRLQQKIDIKCGSERVILTGRLDSQDVPRYLVRACALVLARPRSVQAQYGFPTKLGEYLATGNPVVVTDVGEISDFIKDEDNGFMVQPGDANAFAEKLDYVLSNPQHARQIGLKGRSLALTVFNYQQHGPRLIEFIKGLRQKRNNSQNQ